MTSMFPCFSSALGMQTEKLRALKEQHVDLLGLLAQQQIK